MFSTRRAVLFGSAAALSQRLVRSADGLFERRIIVTKLPAGVEIESGSIRALFTRTKYGVAQEYWARRESEWSPVLKSVLRVEPSDNRAAPLFQDTIAREYRILIGGGFDRIRVSGQQARVTVRLSGKQHGHHLEQTIVFVCNSIIPHVDVWAKLHGRHPRIEYLLSSFTFEPGTPDFTHLPSMKRASDDFAGDRVFHSPAAVAQKGSVCVALVPDLDTL